MNNINTGIKGDHSHKPTAQGKFTEGAVVVLTKAAGVFTPRNQEIVKNNISNNSNHLSLKLKSTTMGDRIYTSHR